MPLVGAFDSAQVRFKEPLYKGGRTRNRPPGWCDRVLVKTFDWLADRMIPVVVKLEKRSVYGEDRSRRTSRTGALVGKTDHLRLARGGDANQGLLLEDAEAVQHDEDIEDEDVLERAVADAGMEDSDSSNDDNTDVLSPSRVPASTRGTRGRGSTWAGGPSSAGSFSATELPGVRLHESDGPSSGSYSMSQSNPIGVFRHQHHTSAPEVRTPKRRHWLRRLFSRRSRAEPGPPPSPAARPSLADVSRQNPMIRTSMRLKIEDKFERINRHKNELWATITTDEVSVYNSPYRSLNDDLTCADHSPVSCSFRFQALPSLQDSTHLLLENNVEQHPSPNEDSSCLLSDVERRRISLHLSDGTPAPPFRAVLKLRISHIMVGVKLIKSQHSEDHGVVCCALVLCSILLRCPAA